jgi:tRNA-splicing ligase RtcB
MPQKKDFNKISNWLWEIPKFFRRDMKVPARAYVSEKMLEEALKDRSLEQLINVATLPGIVNYSMAMPDMHEGYGFPIGGVAAMDVKNGVISPGGVGYDLNCLSGDAQILHSLGYTLPIKDFEKKWTREQIKCSSFKKRSVVDSLIIYFLKRKANPSIYQITTTGERTIRATKDHPFYTPKGMISVERLKLGGRIAINPFRGVKFKQPAKKIIVSEKDIEKIFLAHLSQNPSGHGLSQVVSQLKKRRILPLGTNSPQFPYLLKIMGYLLGDGTMYFTNKKGKGMAWFYGGKEVLKELGEDIKKIGFSASKIYYRTRLHKIRTAYKKYEFLRTETSIKVSSTGFVTLLVGLGMPVGNKANQSFLLPEWIFNLPLWQKRLFLASFFGAELSSPSNPKNHPFTFYTPILSLNKREDFEKNGIKFLQQIAQLLREFGVRTLKISQRHEQENKDKSKSIRIRLIIASQSENLKSLWGKIGYNYHKEKAFLANAAIFYLQEKQKFIKEKILTQGIKSRKGLILWKGKPQLLQKTVLYGGVSLPRPLIGQFPPFKKFIKEITQGLGKSGLAWDKIKKIEEIPYQDFVYDFTINNINHNFIANGFVVSNCGMRLLKSEYTEKDIKPYLEDLATEIQKEVPSGLGRGRQTKVDISSLNKILEGGAQRLVEQGYGEKEDLENCESGGRLSQADSSIVSDRAKDRGRDQVGTLGSGNHFLEIQKVGEIFDEKVAEVFGLFKDQVVIMIHTGSRGLGHQIATDYIRLMMKAMPKYNINLPDRELAACPFNSPEGQRYFSAMACGANFAWANRQMIAHYIRKAWKSVLGEKATFLIPLYDVAHNIAKIEKYVIGGKERELCIHRKGATRAFPPGHPEILKKYQEVGQPVIIPGSMGTASYILTGAESGEEAWYSTCHGAGRTMSRHQAVRTIDAGELIKKLEEKGILIKCWSLRGIAEEAPQAYKNIDEVVEVVHSAGLSRKVARLMPLAVIKGE